jgi:hypothetical protein
MRTSRRSPIIMVQTALHEPSSMMKNAKMGWNQKS